MLLDVMAKVLKSWTKKVNAMIKIHQNLINRVFKVKFLNHSPNPLIAISMSFPLYTINHGYEYDQVHFLCFPFFCHLSTPQLLNIPKPILTLLYAQCALHTSVAKDQWTLSAAWIAPAKYKLREWRRKWKKGPLCLSYV